MIQSIKNLIAATLIAISGFIFWTLILPTYQFARQIKLVIQERSDILNARLEILNKIENIIADTQNKYTELQRLALVIPEKKGIPELISSIEAVFAKSGNILLALSTSENPSEDKGTVNRVFVEIGAQGTYSNLVNMLEYIEGNIRIFDVTSFSALAETSTLEQPNPLLNFKISGDIYWVKPQTASQDKSNTTPAPNGSGNGI